MWPAPVARQRLGGETELAGDEADHIVRQGGRIRNRPALCPGPGKEQGQTELVAWRARGSDQLQVLSCEREEAAKSILVVALLRPVRDIRAKGPQPC